MAKFIAHAPNGQAYQCDSLAEVKQVEGGFKFRKAKKRNPLDKYGDPPHAIVEAAFLARDYHGGQSSGLYALSGGQWEHLTADDYARAAREFERILSKGEEQPEDYDSMHEAVAALKREAAALERNPRKKRNGGCGCAGMCGNPHCGPKRRNGGRKMEPPTKWRVEPLTGNTVLFVMQESWGDRYERMYTRSGLYNDMLDKYGKRFADKVLQAADQILKRNPRRRRNPAGQGEDYNMAAFAGAVEHGLLPPKNATPDYKKGYAEGARIAKQNKLAVAAALGAFRSTKSQAKAGELLREMAGTASTSTPIGNPRKKRNPVGADPRYVPVGNPKPKGKYLAHEKEEEQIFASMLSKLPVGVTMKAGKFRVRKLSKGFVVVDGERLSMKDAAAKLHGR